MRGETSYVSPKYATSGDFPADWDFVPAEQIDLSDAPAVTPRW
jgi:hypothetical protein